MTTDVNTRPIIKIGSKGPEVAKIQTALQNVGFSPGRIDSDFGLKTDQAVRYFQVDHHLKVDGIVGKDTWALLQKLSTPTQGAPVNTTSQMQKYTVQPDDSLWKIAQKYQVNWVEIKNANPDIHDPNNLQVGKVINIPNAAGGSVNTNPHMQQHEVKLGDTLDLIARQYKVSVDDIKKANPGIKEDNLPIGKILNIPNARAGTDQHYQNRPYHCPDAYKIEWKPNHQIIWNFFRRNGFSEEATAGIMGNLEQESHMEPRAIQRNKRNKEDWSLCGRGLAQWETKHCSKHGSGRWDILEAKAHGRQWDLNFQLEYILKEWNERWMQNLMRQKGYSMEKLKHTTDIEYAARVFLKAFEMAGTALINCRYAYAHEIYKRFAGARI